MMGFEVLLEVFSIGELTFWEYLIGLPVGTTFPPAAVAPSITVEAPFVTVLFAKVS